MHYNLNEHCDYGTVALHCPLQTNLLNVIYLCNQRQMFNYTVIKLLSNKNKSS